MMNVYGKPSADGIYVWLLLSSVSFGVRSVVVSGCQVSVTQVSG